MTRNRAIGMNNTLPWKQRNDLQRFKGLTYGTDVLMGRKTWDSMGGKPLPGRINTVATRDAEFRANFYQNVAVDDRDGVVDDVEMFLTECSFYNNDLFVIGGEQIYTKAMYYAERIFLTVLDVEILGDAFFPEIDDSKWKKIAEEKYTADDANQYGYNFLTYVRK